MKTKLNLLVAVMFLAATSSALATVRYVWQSSPGPAPPYTNWATAAPTIQQAVDAAVAGDEIVVTNGIYATGARVVYGWMTNRAAVDKPLALRSVNGAQASVIDGGSAVGCVYLTNGATLLGFTLANGMAEFGGGVYCDRAMLLTTVPPTDWREEGPAACRRPGSDTEMAPLALPAESIGRTASHGSGKFSG